MQDVKTFIAKCLGPEGDRPSVAQLLVDEFLKKVLLRHAPLLTPARWPPGAEAVALNPASRAPSQPL